MSNTRDTFYKEAVRTEPGHFFASPEDLVKEDKLTHNEKLEILKTWADQVDRLLDSGNEGMPTRGTEPRDAELLRQIELAKEQLEENSASSH